MQVDGLEVRHMTTDPDTAAYRAAEDLYVEGLCNTKPDHLLDTRHLSENVRKKIKNDKKLTQMMPAATKVEREKLCSRFALDMTFRCTAERSQATNHYKGDFLKIKSGISYTVDAIAHCYMGDHNLCKKYSLVCDGGDNNWIARSTFLPRNFAVTVQDTNPDDTKNKLRECVNLRLGQAILNKTKLNTNTQKSESANKILRRSVPRHTNFAANFPGRCHAGVHACNHGAAESIVKLCDGAGCPIAPGSSVAKCLKSEQTIYNQKKSYNSSEKNVQSKCKKRREMFDLYQEFHEQSQYEKGQLLPKIWTTQRRKKCEHSYAKEYK